MRMQTIQEMFTTTRGGKHQTGRCEGCDEVLTIDEVKICDDCQFQDMIEEGY